MILNEPEWTKLAASAEDLPFAANGIAELEVQDKRICIARYKDTLTAFVQTCPHAGGRFANGFIDALGNVVCPLHRYKFCLKNGRNVSGEGYWLKRWPVRVEAEGVFVRV